MADGAAGVIVTLHAGVTAADRDAFVARCRAAGLAARGYRALTRVVRIDGVSVAAFAALAVARDPAILDVDAADRPVHGATDQTLTISAAFWNASWGIARVIRRDPPWPTRLPFPWTTIYRCARDGTGVDIYFVDTGLRTTHDEFGGRATTVAEIVSSGGVGDDFGHGTAVAGCAAGATVGLARGALLWSVKALDSTNSGTQADALDGIDACLAHYQGRAATNRPAVLNLSLTGYSVSFGTTLADCIDAGMVVVICAGNTRADLGSSDQYPAESDVDAIVVGGTGPADIPYFSDMSGSNWGTRIDVSAPSHLCYTVGHGNDTGFWQWSGTSFGCGYVSGVVACLLQGHNRLTTRTQVQAVKAHLMTTATTGRLTNPAGFGMTLPDRLVYLDPEQEAPEPIAGL